MLPFVIRWVTSMYSGQVSVNALSVMSPLEWYESPIKWSLKYDIIHRGNNMPIINIQHQPLYNLDLIHSELSKQKKRNRVLELWRNKCKGVSFCIIIHFVGCLNDGLFSYDATNGKVIIWCPESNNIWTHPLLGNMTVFKQLKIISFFYCLFLS